MESDALRDRFDRLRSHFETHGQGHVFAFWDRLDPAARERLLDQAEGLDLAASERAFRATRGDRARAPAKLEPVAVERAPGHGGDPERHARARRGGEELLAEGRVAVFVVAGGQATRLGFDGPKGTYPLGPVTGRTLFELQAQKLRGLRRRCGRALPWLVMTSPATDAATREFFRERDHLGLPAEDVRFVVQRTVPSLDPDGKLVLERPDRIFENPNGHGGSLTALRDSGALDWLAERGIDTIFYYQVDNPLIRLADPAFLGFHSGAEAEMSCKVVRKRKPGEKMGVVARADGRIQVVEYTEIDDETASARDAGGELVYWAGNTAIHVLDREFVRRVARDADERLPYHASKKKIPTVDSEGRPVAPEEPNGWKLERFVFDALPHADGVCVVEALREHEYSPVKNAEGVDSPQTARRDLEAEVRRWLREADVALPDDSVAIEVDHARVDGPEEARALGIRRVEDAGDAIRTGSGGAR